LQHLRFDALLERPLQRLFKQVAKGRSDDAGFAGLGCGGREGAASLEGAGVEQRADSTA